MKTVIEIMARSVGARAQQNKNRDVEYLMDQASLERFAELVRADEREACAKVCDFEADRKEAEGTWLWEARRCAAAIRARSNT